MTLSACDELSDVGNDLNWLQAQNAGLQQRNAGVEDSASLLLIRSDLKPVFPPAAPMDAATVSTMDPILTVRIVVKLGLLAVLVEIINWLIVYRTRGGLVAMLRRGAAWRTMEVHASVESPPAMGGPAWASHMQPLTVGHPGRPLGLPVALPATLPCRLQEPHHRCYCNQQAGVQGQPPMLCSAIKGALASHPCAKGSTAAGAS